jgi:hypothetical protein
MSLHSRLTHPSDEDLSPGTPAHALRYTRDCILKVFFPQDAPFSEVFSWLIAKIPLWRLIPKIVISLMTLLITGFVPPP